MPHDANGVRLIVGDKVSITGTVTQISEGDNYCNCTVDVDLPMPPYMTKTNISAINTKQLVKL